MYNKSAWNVNDPYGYIANKKQYTTWNVAP